MSRVSVGANESLCDSFAHQKSAISGDVDQTLRVSFASRRNGVPADSSEIKRFPRHQNLRFPGTSSETRRVSDGLHKSFALVNAVPRRKRWGSSAYSSHNGTDSLVNYLALLAPSRLAAVGHSSRAALYRNDIVPRDPVRGRGPASFSRPRVGRGLSGPPSTVAVDCPAGLIPGVLALCPQAGNGSRTRSRSSFPSAGPEGIALGPQEPGYSWLLPSSACARAAVNREMAQGAKTGRLAVKVDEDGRSSPPCRPLCSRLRKGARRPAPLPLNDR